MLLFTLEIVSFLLALKQTCICLTLVSKPFHLGPFEILERHIAYVDLTKTSVAAVPN